MSCCVFDLLYGFSDVSNEQLLLPTAFDVYTLQFKLIPQMTSVNSLDIFAKLSDKLALKGFESAKQYGECAKVGVEHAKGEGGSEMA